MVILALETVTRAGSIALWRDGATATHAGSSTRTHVERLPEELLEFMDAHGIGLADVDVLVVVSGPGSFTGMRVGLAAAQGLAMAAKTRTLGVPTLDALGEAGLADPRVSRLLVEGVPPLVVPCLDGQRSDVFFSALVPGQTGTIDDVACVLEGAVATADEAADAIAARRHGRRVVLVGDGAIRHPEPFTRALVDPIVVVPTISLAEAAARVAARHAERAGAPHALRPVYIRRPDAEIARERHARQVAAAAKTEPSVRRLSSDADLAAVAALQRATFTNPWGADSIRWELDNTDVSRLYGMHDPSGRLIGYCACWVVFDELHLNSVAVDETCRRQGVARALLQHVLSDAHRAGVTAATLEVRGSNRPALALYQSLGFRVEGVRRDYYQDPREDALILWRRRLDPAP